MGLGAICKLCNFGQIEMEVGLEWTKKDQKLK